ncbi:uncharacterized protein LOC117119117 isoform X2 [Anneissia japonica]|nr:uncharacterized protein LOC117119117 isoform X2 [Anneissia japonica]XP_033119822.1 uncharacterized protein LOC117119117 isoform X2 [Anneissia japonica]
MMYAVVWFAVSLGLTLAAEWAPYGIFFIGSGYNILDGNPQGSKDYGGADPGLLSTRNVFDFHFDEDNLSDDGKYTIPDEMTVSVNKSCTNTTRQQAVSGGWEYQKGLKYNLGQRRFNESDINVTMEILFIGLEFTASLGFEFIVEGTRDLEYVYYAESNECSLAKASLKLDEVKSSKYFLSRSFVINACSLPKLYDQQTYFDFIDLWGTHVVVEVELGVRQSERYTSSRNEFVRYAMREAEASVGVGVELFNWAASIVIDIDRFHQSMTKQTKFGSNRVVITNGNEELSEPIKLNLIRMDELFTNAFWTQFNSYTEQGLCSKAWKSSLPVTRLNVQRAMLAYPLWRHVEKAEDPVVQIPITWPLGAYGLPKPAAGCPPNIDFPWHSGYRYQDTENDRANNYWSDPLHFEGPYSVDNMEQDFCMKTQYKGGEYDWTWPEGSYCIFKKGSTCPDGLDEGYIYWDDENRHNANSFGGSVPEGKYDDNTRIEYCCKRDVINARATYLPTDSPFYLLSESNGCQKVHGMDVTEEFFRWDDEDSSNSNDKGGAHPFDSGDKTNHVLHYCYYQPV